MILELRLRLRGVGAINFNIGNGRVNWSKVTNGHGARQFFQEL